MTLIATYPEMSKIFLHMTEKKGNIIAFDEYASFEDAVKVAKRIENDVDVILSRGGTAEFIRCNVRVPVVFIPITPFDVVQAMRKPPPDIKEVASSGILLFMIFSEIRFWFQIRYPWARALITPSPLYGIYAIGQTLIHLPQVSASPRIGISLFSSLFLSVTD